MEKFSENFKVVVRIRPFLKRELDKGITFPVIDVQENEKSMKIFEFMVN